MCKSRTLLALALALASVVSAVAQQKAPVRGIVRVTGELYRAQNDIHYTVFLVTPQGIIMSDPINRDFARWLKGEFAARFKVPVRYVLYSHKDWDHASGGVVFADTAEFVGHVNMRAGLALPSGNPPLPAEAAAMDTNRNGLIERSEATGATAAQFDLFDEDRSSVLTGAEVIRGPANDVYPPDITFRDRHTVTLGDKRVEMVYLGAAHSDDMSALYFPDERAVFGVDVLNVKRLPLSITPTVGAYADAVRTILTLDFEHATAGHGMIGTKQDVVMSLQYLEDLAAGVAAGIASGRSLSEIQKTLTLDAYKSWERYGTHRTLHIAQVYAVLKGASTTN